MMWDFSLSQLENTLRPVPKETHYIFDDEVGWLCLTIGYINPRGTQTDLANISQMCIICLSELPS